MSKKKSKKHRIGMVNSMKDQKPAAPQGYNYGPVKLKDHPRPTAPAPASLWDYEPLKIFVGFDDRQPVSFTTLMTSIYRRCRLPVAVTPLVLPTLPLARRGLTPFTWSRFLVPYLCGFKGWALFMDIDMILLDDVSKLFALKDDRYAAMVSKNDLRFEWASMILFNCGHPSNQVLTPNFIENAKALHGLQWLKEDEVGDLPREWNHLVGYDQERRDAKLVHYTQGVPAYPETSDSEYAAEWIKEAEAAMGTQPWATLLGNSVHAKLMNGKLVPKYKKETV